MFGLGLVVDFTTQKVEVNLIKLCRFEKSILNGHILCILCLSAHVKVFRLKMYETKYTYKKANEYDDDGEEREKLIKVNSLGRYDS